MRPGDLTAAAEAVRGAALPLAGTPDDFDALLARIGDARVVLLGEATHGTHDFYRVRAELTKRLIRERGFRAIAVEADWPDAHRVDRFIRGRGDDHDATEALAGFQRFPQWMWRNADILDLVGWLRNFNDLRPTSERVGFYGLDLYSLHASMDAVVSYLRMVDPEAAERAVHRYACFDHFGGDPQDYGRLTTLGVSPTCERGVLAQLRELRAATAAYARRDGRLAPDDHFFAERNAEIVATAEQYYRAMFLSATASWNLRDRHMADTLESLEQFLATRGPTPKIVVWAHNSHQGDARATALAARGEENLGQYVRQRLGSASVLVGFSTYDGTVTAAEEWGGPALRMQVRPGLWGSYEALFHATGLPAFYLDLLVSGRAREALLGPRLQRAIGVIYRPITERASHYYEVRLPQQFDALFYYDRTRAVEPLERTAEWARGPAEVPETYPSAL